MSTREKFLSDVEAFLARTGMPPSIFGKKAVNDPAFVQRLREGIDPRTRTMDRVVDFMKSNARPTRGRRKAELRPAA